MKLSKLFPCILVLSVVVSTALFARNAQPVKSQPTVRNDHTPIAPQIPGADRNNLNRVFLEHADMLSSKAGTDYQILSGNVEFRRGGMFMYCDSAHFYDKTGSFEAFGNVRMEQGDTLFVYGDALWYSDAEQLAKVYVDTDEDYTRKARLINRNVTLTSDTLCYDLAASLGFYDYGGKLVDSKNELTSIIGEYNPTTKEATFFEHVVLTSRSDTDTLRIVTDNLYYNTLTHVAELTDFSQITNRDGTIFTTNGRYNTESTLTELFDRSTVVSKNGNTITGDTLFYNRNTGIGEAFGNIEICDTANKITMLGDYGFYNELMDSAFVTGRAHAIEYSQGDSIHLHGDTIRTFRVIIPPTAVEAPATAPQPEEPTEPEELAEPTEPAESVETVESVETAETVETTKSDEPAEAAKVELPVVKTDPDTVRYLVAAPHVRFFRQDVQGVCDSMTFVSLDTMIWLNYSPIIWSDNRQISGDVIQLHLNDSTVDWARVPTNSFMAEYIEDGYFNQLAGKEMIANFLDGKLRHLDVNGNVLAVTFPEEEDSTINKVTNIESSFLAADFKDNTIEKMKLWSETNATVTPLYLAKRSIFFLQQFQWWDALRPKDPDDIFNFSDQLLLMFEEARKKQSPSSKPYSYESEF